MKPPIDMPAYNTEQDILCETIEALINKHKHCQNSLYFVLVFGVLAGCTGFLGAMICGDAILHEKSLALSAFVGILFFVSMICTIISYIAYKRADTPDVIRCKILKLAKGVEDATLKDAYIHYAKYPSLGIH